MDSRFLPLLAIVGITGVSALAKRAGGSRGVRLRSSLDPQEFSDRRYDLLARIIESGVWDKSMSDKDRKYVQTFSDDELQVFVDGLGL
jgi:hypothetical protein